MNPIAELPRHIFRIYFEFTLEDLLIINACLTLGSAYLLVDMSRGNRIRDNYNDVLVKYMKGQIDRDKYLELFGKLPRVIGYFSSMAKKEARETHQLATTEEFKDRLERILSDDPKPELSEAEQALREAIENSL